MYTIEPGPFTLSCHPQTTSHEVREIDVVAGVSRNDGITLTFRLVGDITGLAIPGPRSPRRADNLWQHTCFEVFMMVGEGPGYREFNFSPSGEWAVYDFRGYRDASEQDGALLTKPDPVIKVQQSLDRLELSVEIDQGLLPQASSLKLGLSAVVENVAGSKSYWALRHAPGKPDFHHADAFALQMRRL
jgi:hypothetical protein